VIDNYQYIDLIESANDRQPFCACGRPTEPVYRDGVVWLECSSFRQPPQSRLARFAAAVTALSHVHERIVEIPASDEALAPAA
jgi:hypothetical protein